MLPRIEPKRKSGKETFRVGGNPVGFDLLSYWRWSASDLVSNVTRGVLAEYIVAQAAGAVVPVRAEWDAYDLETPDRIKIEVKSAAYVQCWCQKKHSDVKFEVRPTEFWDAATSETDTEPRYHADGYVFALLVQKDQDAIDPLDLDQWQFYVLSRSEIAAHPTRSFRLSGLQKLTGAVRFGDLVDAIRQAVQRQAHDGPK